MRQGRWSPEAENGKGIFPEAGSTEGAHLQVPSSAEHLPLFLEKTRFHLAPPGVPKSRGVCFMDCLLRAGVAIHHNIRCRTCQICLSTCLPCYDILPLSLKSDQMQSRSRYPSALPCRGRHPDARCRPVSDPRSNSSAVAAFCCRCGELVASPGPGSGIWNSCVRKRLESEDLRSLPAFAGPQPADGMRMRTEPGPYRMRAGSPKERSTKVWFC